MINPTDSAPQQGAFLMQNIPPVLPNFTPPEDEQKRIVAICNEFKKNVVDHGQEKKQRMRTAYAYIRGKFVGGDLLPIPSTAGSEKDNNKARPQVFIPASRQQLKTIHSQLKGNFFPNDEDYFRVRAKTSAGMDLEDPLTEGLKYVFREAMVSEKLGAAIYSLIWSGMFVVLPKIKDDFIPEWSFQEGRKDPETNEQIVPDVYNARPVMDTAKIDVVACRPMNFYVDPTVQDPERAKWVYIDSKRVQEIKDSNLYINKDKLDDIDKKDVRNDISDQGTGTAEITSLQDTFRDVEDTVKYDLYYFPYLKTETAEYRNFFAGVANEQVLVRFNPNTFPRGLNPMVFCSWMFDPEDPYSQGPIEDGLEIQKLINILYNYKIEVMARAGNRFAVRPNVDLTNFFGVAGGVCVAEDPQGDVVNFSGDYAEIAAIDNTIGVLKAELQLVSGSQNPFQGSSNVDYQKTATELQIVQENSISVTRETIEHIGVMGIQRVLERLMYLVADMYDQPIEIPMKDQMGNRIFNMVDFSVLKSGQFTIELIGINPSQSKQAQINGLLKILEASPEVIAVMEPILEKVGDLLGIKNIRELLEKIKQRIPLVQQVQAMEAMQQQMAEQQAAQAQQGPPVPPQ